MSKNVIKFQCFRDLTTTIFKMVGQGYDPPGLKSVKRAGLRFKSYPLKNWMGPISWPSTPNSPHEVARLKLTG